MLALATSYDLTLALVDHSALQEGSERQVMRCRHRGTLLSVRLCFPTSQRGAIL